MRWFKIDISLSAYQIILHVIVLFNINFGSCWIAEYTDGKVCQTDLLIKQSFVCSGYLHVVRNEYIALWCSIVSLYRGLSTHYILCLPTYSALSNHRGNLSLYNLQKTSHSSPVMAWESLWVPVCNSREITILILIDGARPGTIKHNTPM